MNANLINILLKKYYPNGKHFRLSIDFSPCEGIQKRQKLRGFLRAFKKTGGRSGIKPNIAKEIEHAATEILDYRQVKSMEYGK